MSTEVTVPALPESVSEATVATWHKAEGDRIKRDEVLVELETDKVMLEVPATADGVLKEIRAKEGDTVSASDVIAVVEEGAASGGADAKADAGEADKASKAKGADGAAQDEGEGEGEGDSDDSADAGHDGQSPAVRRLLSEHGLSADDIRGSGKGGRLTKADVEAHLKQAGEKADAQPKPAGRAAAEAPASPGAAAGSREEQRVPMTRIRARIAERLVQAQQTAAMLTTFNEVDLEAVSGLRARHKDHFEKQHGVRLGFMSFFVKAAIEALKRYPLVNASIDGTDIVYHNYYDIGIAVSSPRGLVVPILRDADTLSFAEIEKAIGDFGSRAKDNKLSMEDLTGGTFSITNGGVFGSMLSTPILNPPQSAILGMHGIQQRPMVVDGEIRIRPMMYLALTYDHRIIDGREAVLFLRGIKEFLEDPAKLLLGL